MLGEELNAAEVTKRGLSGDRAYALVDSTDGKVASAKNPRKWPQLFDCRAALTDIPRSGVEPPPVRITLPDGTIVNSEQANLNQIFSKMLKRAVHLASTYRDRRPALHATSYWPSTWHATTVSNFSRAWVKAASKFGDCRRSITTRNVERVLPSWRGLIAKLTASSSAA